MSFELLRHTSHSKLAVQPIRIVKANGKFRKCMTQV